MLMRNGRVGFQTARAEGPNAGVHPMTDDVAVEPSTQTAKLLLMFCIEGVGGFERSKILDDPGFLNVGVLAIPFDGRRAQAVCSRAETAQALAVGKRRLQNLQKRAVENESFQVDPSAIQFDLDPRMKNLFRRDRVDQFRHHAALKALVDREPVDSTTYPPHLEGAP